MMHLMLVYILWGRGRERGQLAGRVTELQIVVPETPERPTVGCKSQHAAKIGCLWTKQAFSWPVLKVIFCPSVSPSATPSIQTSWSCRKAKQVRLPKESQASTTIKTLISVQCTCFWFPDKSVNFLEKF